MTERAGPSIAGTSGEGPTAGGRRARRIVFRRLPTATRLAVEQRAGRRIAPVSCSVRDFRRAGQAFGKPCDQEPRPNQPCQFPNLQGLDPLVTDVIFCGASSRSPGSRLGAALSKEEATLSQASYPVGYPWQNRGCDRHSPSTSAQLRRRPRVAPERGGSAALGAMSAALPGSLVTHRRERDVEPRDVRAGG
jgi:hypothetical protein